MEIQATLGSDIAMVLDECAPYPCDYELRGAKRGNDNALGEEMQRSRRCHPERSRRIPWNYFKAFAAGFLDFAALRSE